MSESKHTPGVREVAVFQSAGQESYTVWARLPDGSKEAIFSTQNRGDACLDAAAPQMLEALREAPTPRDGEPPEFFAVRCLKWLRTHRDPTIAAATGGEQ